MRQPEDSDGIAGEFICNEYPDLEKKTTTSFYVRPLSIVKIWRANRGEYNEIERSMKNKYQKLPLEMIATKL